MGGPLCYNRDNSFVMLICYNKYIKRFSEVIEKRDVFLVILLGVGKGGREKAKRTKGGGNKRIADNKGRDVAVQSVQGVARREQV